jgi:UDP-N-acetylglucosamine transferase subunit ALG13
MIFVTVGMHESGFDRLVKAADELASLVDEEVVIQRGSTTYLPLHAESFAWATYEEIEERIRAARVIVSHAGAGSIIQVLQIGKPLVVVSRLHRYGEHHNDHQLQLTEGLISQGRAVTVEEVSAGSLRAAIEAAGKQKRSRSGHGELASAVRDQLAAWSAQKKS